MPGRGDSRLNGAGGIGDGTVSAPGLPGSFVKRVLDIVITVIAIVLLAPFLLLMAAAIKLDSPGPVFYIQERVGKDRALFRVLKFRTMVPGAINQGLGVYTAPDDPRITRVGAFLRRWSLDELPQLFNILRGEMSVVGPRPTLEYQVDAYTPRQMNRQLVKPGLTGLAQVKGRNAISWAERIELDNEYIASWNPWLDVRIMLMTVATIFARKGIYDEAADGEEKKG